MQNIANYMMTIGVNFTYNHTGSPTGTPMISYNPVGINPEYQTNLNNLIASEGKTQVSLNTVY